MWPTRLGVIALLSSSAYAFQNTSPFFLFSTSSLSITEPTVQLASADSLSIDLPILLASCPSEAYFIVTQPDVSDEDYLYKNSAPQLQSWLNSTSAGNGPSSMTVAEVVGQLDADLFSVKLEVQCRATVVSADTPSGYIPNISETPRIVRLDFLPLEAHSIKERTLSLAENDAFLHAAVSNLGGDSYTIIYTTSPPSASFQRTPPTYTMDSSDEYAMKTDLKRDLNSRAKGGKNNDTQDRWNSDLPLFEKYQFLDTGLFVGIAISLLLLSILYVGISAIAGLEVSYFAFSKEMGPSQQKKQ